MSIISILANNNYITVNKDIAKEFGLHEAILLGELASEYVHWENKDGLDKDGYFYSTIENVEKNTTLGEKAQRSAINTLVSAGIITVKRKGLPAKRYIKFNIEAILQFLTNKNSQNGGTCDTETAEVDTDKKQVNNNTENSNKEEVIKEDSITKRPPKFEIPTIEQLTAYCEYYGNEKGCTIDPYEIFDHYQARGWKFSTGGRVEDWKACVRNWVRTGKKFAQERQQRYGYRPQQQQQTAKSTWDDLLAGTVVGDD